MIKYYDVSSFQGQMNVPSDATAIVAKATEGTYYRDSEYGWFKQQAANRNLPFSGYHFLKAESDPAAQAAFYFAFAGNTPCMLDVETENASKPGVDQVVSFMQALQRLGGRVWGVYFPRWYWGQVGGNLGRLTAAGAVVIASEYRSFDDNNWPAPYGGATAPIWQYTSTPIDTNAYKGTAAQLAALINGTTPVPVPVETPTPSTSTVSGDDNMPVFATGVVAPGDGAVTVVLPPPANMGANWGNVWFSLGADFGTATVRVAIFTHGQGWSHIYEGVVVDSTADRINPFGGPLPTGVQKISIERKNNPAVPVAYLIEAAGR